MRNTVRRAHREAEMLYKNKLGTLIKENNKCFWKYVKSKRGKKTGISSIISQSGDLVFDAKGIANALNAQYKKVFCDATHSSKIYTPNCRTSETMPPVCIDYNGIVGLLENIKANKASGPDGISGTMLKCCAKVAAMFLKFIFEQSLATGDIPADWRNAIVHPVFKGGNSKQPENYRPISLTCICCKMMERILVSSITTYLEETNQLHHNQYGFRRHFSCESQLIALCEDTLSSLDKRCSVDLAFIDFSKAFDTVSHDCLIEKLNTYNLDTKVRSWIKSFLTNRTQRVIIDNCQSDEITVTSGVAQGSVIGPILFLLYINDLPDRMKCSIRMFADDVVIYTNVMGGIGSSSKLQEDLNMLIRWCEEWKMSVNVKKCAIMRMSRNKCAVTPAYYLCNSVIPVVNEFKYLGVIISNTGSWQKHVDYVASKSNQMLRFIKRTFKGCPQSVKESVYVSLVRPLLEYSSCAWDPCAEGLKHQLEMVQRRAARFVLNNYTRDSSVSEMLSEIGWNLLETRRKIARLCLMFNIYHGYGNLGNHIEKPHYVSRNDHQKKIRRIQSQLLSYHNSFFPKTIREWNQLNGEAMQVKTVQEFKAMLQPS